MPDLNSLAVFAKVVEAKSFSEAARRLGMPISTVSRRVAELEDQLGVRLLERSTRRLRLTDIGSELLEHAQRSAELGELVDNLISNQLASVAGVLRLSAPPSISDTLLTPLICAFQTSYPSVRVHALVTDRYIDHVAESVDLVFRIGMQKDSALVARRILTYRRQLVASPSYLQNTVAPQSPSDLHTHRLVAFSRGNGEHSWSFGHVNSRGSETITFNPHLSMNDFAGLAPALVSGAGIGDLSPLVQPHLVRDGLLVEVMPNWRFQTSELCIVHLGNRHMPRPARLFKEFATQMAPKLFSALPT